MAAKLSGEFPQLTVPGWLTERFETDKEAGVEFACDLVCQLRGLRPVRRGPPRPCTPVPRGCSPAGGSPLAHSGT